MSAKELAQHVYGCFGRGDLQGILNVLSTDVVWELIGPSSIPYFGRYTGRQGVEHFFVLLNEHEEVLEFEPQEFIEEGDIVAVRGREKCRSKQSGRSYEARWVHIFKTKEGKIVSWCEHIDTVAVAAVYQIPSTGPF